MESRLVFAVIRRPSSHMIQRLGLAIVLIISFLAPSLAADPIEFQTAPTQTPTALEIVERFIQAVGGRDAWLKIKTQYATGTIEVKGSDNKITVEIYGKAPNLVLTEMKMGNSIISRVGFDGEKGWNQAQNGNIQSIAPEKQASQKRDSDLYKYLHFKEHFPDSKVVGIKEVEGAKAYLIEAIPAGEKFPERLYFDVSTGFLLLRDTGHEDGEGKRTADLVYSYDYEEVDGVKLPFRLKILQGDTTILAKITNVKNNLPLDDAIFSPIVSK
jgi:zinc protease